MIERIISGGQSGADQAGWRAAKRFSIPCGGWMPHGYLTEDGPRPEFAELYGAQEHASPNYPPRTRQNVKASDLTLVFDTSVSRDLTGLSKGSRLTINTAMASDIPSVKVTVQLGEVMGKH